MTRLMVRIWGGGIIFALPTGKALVDAINSPEDIADAWRKSMVFVGYVPWLFVIAGASLIIGSLVWPRNHKRDLVEASVQPLPATGVTAYPLPEPSAEIEMQERLVKIDAITARLQAQEKAEADRVSARERKEAAIVALDMSERMVIQPRLHKTAMNKIGMNMEAIQMLQNSLAYIGYDYPVTEKLKADVEAEYKADAQYLAMNDKDHDIWPAATDKRQYLIFCEQRRRMIELIKGVAGQG